MLPTLYNLGETLLFRNCKGINSQHCWCSLYGSDIYRFPTQYVVKPSACWKIIEYQSLPEYVENWNVTQMSFIRYNCAAWHYVLVNEILMVVYQFETEGSTFNVWISQSLLRNLYQKIEQSHCFDIFMYHHTSRCSLGDCWSRLMVVELTEGPTEYKHGMGDVETGTFQRQRKRKFLHYSFKDLKHFQPSKRGFHTCSVLAMMALMPTLYYHIFAVFFFICTRWGLQIWNPASMGFRVKLQSSFVLFISNDRAKHKTKLAILLFLYCGEFLKTSTEHTAVFSLHKRPKAFLFFKKFFRRADSSGYGKRRTRCNDHRRIRSRKWREEKVQRNRQHERHWNHWRWRRRWKTQTQIHEEKEQWVYKVTAGSYSQFKSYRQWEAKKGKLHLHGNILIWNQM